MSSNKSVGKTATSRLKQDYMRLKRDPVPYIDAEPLAANILEWHYVVRGPEDSPYKGGYYHGKLVFPREFPFKPPSIYMFTPNGRFKVHTRLCLSISDFHPDTWNPAWSVATILTGLLSFMLETTPTLGSIESSISTKRKLAEESGPTNLRNTVFCELFPELVKEIEAAERKRRQDTAAAEERRRGAEQKSNGAETSKDACGAVGDQLEREASDLKLEDEDEDAVSDVSDLSELSELSENEEEE